MITMFSSPSDHLTTPVWGPEPRVGNLCTAVKSSCSLFWTAEDVAGRTNCGQTEIVTQWIAVINWAWVFFKTKSYHKVKCTLFYLRVLIVCPPLIILLLKLVIFLHFSNTWIFLLSFQIFTWTKARIFSSAQKVIKQRRWRCSYLQIVL